MLGEVLQFLKDRVNDHLRTTGGWRPTDPEQQAVVFPGSESVDAPDFKLEHVTLLVVNLEEDHTLRSADPNRRALADGTTQHVKPPIIINVYVLFVARFKEYDQSMQHLSRILEFFQSHRVFDHTSGPALDDGIEKLTLELVTQSFLEQNNLWGLLRAAYHPSLLYRIRMIVVSDAQGIAAPGIIDTITIAQPVPAPSGVV
ncbi:MAG TPA: DUF4255 domain-containing protein [Kofleriaceae bacterium]